MRHRFMFVAVIFLVSLGGCASYTTPGRGAPMEAFGVDGTPLTDSQAIAEKLGTKPLVTFPATIAIVRVQAPGYRSRTCQDTYGDGRYTVVTTHDIEPADTLQRIGKLPMVAQAGPINRLLLHEHLNSDKDLREAAAALHAQLTLIYTVDTVFKTDDHAMPLTLISFGLSPNRSARAFTTVSAVLMDTRNGYVYGIAEGEAKADQLANAWNDEEATDNARIQAETKAFNQMLDGFETSWKGVVKQYAVQAK